MAWSCNQSKVDLLTSCTANPSSSPMRRLRPPKQAPGEGGEGRSSDSSGFAEVKPRGRLVWSGLLYFPFYEYRLFLVRYPFLSSHLVTAIKRLWPVQLSTTSCLVTSSRLGICDDMWKDDQKRAKEDKSKRVTEQKNVSSIAAILAPFKRERCCLALNIQSWGCNNISGTSHFDPTFGVDQSMEGKKFAKIVQKTSTPTQQERRGFGNNEKTKQLRHTP